MAFYQALEKYQQKLVQQLDEPNTKVSIVLEEDSCFKITNNVKDNLISSHN